MKSNYGVPATSTGTIRQVSRAEYELRLSLAYGEITLKSFNKRLKILQNKNYNAYDTTTTTTSM